MMMKIRNTGSGIQESKVLVFFLFFGVLLSSCAHSRIVGTPPETSAELSIQNLSSLASDKPLEFFETLTAMAIEPDKNLLIEDSGLASVLADQAVQRIAEDYDKSKKDADFALAFKYFNSLRAIAGMNDERLVNAAATAKARATNAELFELLSTQAETFRNAHQYAPAKNLFLRAFYLFREHEAEFDAAAQAKAMQQFHDWSVYASSQKDWNAAAVLSLTELAGDNSNSLASFPALVSSVVTVYVDRGIKIQQGAGRPDRVLGSAFQIDPAGYYLTNYHVISSEVDPAYNGYSKLSIRPSDNPDERIPAKVIGWNKEMDLALLKSVAAAPFTLYLADKANAEKGQQVFAIGSPIGLENTITSGIISATGRRLLARGDIIQLDAPVNPGNSGGPLIDRSGRVLGIVFAGMADYQGINFALPLSWINVYIPGLFAGGALENTILGILLARNLDASIDIVYSMPGAKVFQAGDKLLALNGEKPQDIPSAQYKLAGIPQGTLIRLDILRDGKSLQVLRRTSVMGDIPLQQAVKNDDAENFMAGCLGMMLQHLSGPRGQGGLYKVIRTWPGLAADEAGIREGDTVKFLRMNIDQRDLLASFVVSVVSRSSGYLEKSFQLTVPLESTSLL